MIRASIVAYEPQSMSGADPPPSFAEITAALARIVTSPRWRAAPRLAAFLSFVVERTLAGRSVEIKSYTIAVEALGRHPSFNPQADAIVRVEAGRLRHALALYYANAGHDDPLVIDLPRGTYVPRFLPRASASPTRRDQRATLQAVFEQLVALRQQLEAMTAEIEIATTLLEQTDPAQRRQN
jgi:hypothetical protein